MMLFEPVRDAFRALPLPAELQRAILSETSLRLFPTVSR